MNLADIPGFIEAYAAAQERESYERDFAWQFKPASVCGVKVQVMTLRQYAYLIAAENECVIYDVRPPEESLLSAEHMAQFLFELRADKCDLKTFCAQIAPLDAFEMQDGIRKYLDFIFEDAPSASGSSIGKAPCTSFVATYIDLLASEYGWTIDQVLDCPMPCVFQLIRRITARKNPNANFINRRTDAIKRQFANQRRCTSPSQARN